MERIETERLWIHRCEIVNPTRHNEHRAVWLAFWKDDDVPRPVCVCTMNERVENMPFCEWIEVTTEERRMGIGREVIVAMRARYPRLAAFHSPATPEGEALIASVERDADQQPARGGDEQKAR